MKVQVRDEAVSKIDDNGDILIVNLLSDDSNYYRVHGIAKETWKHFEDGDSYEDVIAFLLKEYDVTKNEVEKDVKNFIEDLSKFGLIDCEE